MILEGLSIKENIVSIDILDDWAILVHVNPCLILIALVLLAVFLLKLFFSSDFYNSASSLDLDEAEFGIGNHKIKLKANLTDQQVAYAIWVELSTRKIGLEIDFENDVVDEIYDSWYSFFQVTRDLIKTIPVSKVKGTSTQLIISLSVNILNKGIRPHLTKWQARFRRWYSKEMEKKEENSQVIDPQEIQKKYNSWGELCEDMLSVNKRLMAYRRKMESLVWPEKKAKSNNFFMRK